MTDWPNLLAAIDEGLNSSPPVLVDLEQVAPVLGPLPSTLAERATATLRRMTEVEAALDHERAELARELAALSALSVASPAPNFLDTRA